MPMLEVFDGNMLKHEIPCHVTGGMCDSPGTKWAFSFGRRREAFEVA